MIRTVWTLEPAPRAGVGRPRRSAQVGYPYSVIVRCERCRTLSSADWVKVWGLKPTRHGEFSDEPALCPPCRDVFAPIWRAMGDVIANVQMINKLVGNGRRVQAS